MFGQPELDQRLAQDRFRQLRQRISFSYSLRPLNLPETEAYVNYRLKVAGYSGYTLFTKSAMKRLWRSSRGIPRLINVLAHKSLMLAYGKGNGRIKSSLVRYAVADTPDAQKGGRNGSRWLILTLLLLLAAFLALLHEGLLL